MIDFKETIAKWPAIRRIARTLVIIISISCLLFFLIFYRTPIERKYGFHTETPDFRFFPCHIEPIMIRDIQKDSAFDKAGFQEKDILVFPDFYSVHAFRKSLKKPRGTIVEYRVIPFEKFSPDCDFDTTGKTEKRVVVAL